MLNIYLARHGQDEDNINGILNGQRDKDLTTNGLEQAQTVGRKIVDTNIRFDKIYSSPLKRAFKTAQIISEKTNGPAPIIMNDLIERNFGIMTGKPHSSVIKMCSPKVFVTKDINYFLEPEGAETFPQLIERGHKIIEQTKKENSDGNILLVTHGDIGKMIYAAFYNIPWQETLQKFYFGNADLLLLSPNTSPENTHVFKISLCETSAQLKNK